MCALLALGFLGSALAYGETSEGGGSEDWLCQAAIAQFLRAPSGATFAVMDRGAGEECSKLTIEQLQDLDRLASNGNRYAAQILSSQIRHLDGGELEDALRSLGEFASAHMREFMAPAVADALTDQDVADALTMLPLDLEGNVCGQLGELNKRRSALEDLTEPIARQRGKAAIAAIDSFIGEIKRAQSADKSQRESQQ